jgi:hypothetical protein
MMWPFQNDVSRAALWKGCIKNAVYACSCHAVDGLTALIACHAHG